MTKLVHLRYSIDVTNTFITYVNGHFTQEALGLIPTIHICKLITNQDLILFPKILLPFKGKFMNM